MVAPAPTAESEARRLLSDGVIQAKAVVLLAKTSLVTNAVLAKAYVEASIPVLQKAATQLTMPQVMMIDPPDETDTLIDDITPDGHPLDTTFDGNPQMIASR